MSIRPLITALGLNAIPAFGWYFAEWSAGTTLLVYWLETLLATLLVGGRILLHRRMRPSQGHRNYQAPPRETPPGQAPHISRRASYLTAFLVPSTIFICAHGVFLAALGSMMIAKNLTPEARIESKSILIGLISILAFQGIDFLADLIWLRTRPFRWIERQGQQSFGRVAVIHLTIIGGMCAVIFTGTQRDFFGVFIFLKTLLNVSLVLPQYKPATPPAWLSYLMERIPSAKKNDGTTFAQFWQNTDDQEEARIERNETPL